MNEIIFYIITGLLAFAFFSLIIGVYNKFILLKNNIEKSFSNIDILLKQRTDEIPNLIKVVKESKTYEAETLETLTRLRTGFINASSTDEKVTIANALDKNIKSVIAVVENYPELKANNNFVLLQERISHIEESIADRRELYNDSVTLYNIALQEFPNLIFAKLFLFSKKTLLQITEQEKQYHGINF